MFLRVLSHLACCFGTWHVSLLTRFVWTYVNTAIALRSTPKQWSEIAWTRWSRLDWKRTLERFGCSEKAIQSNRQMNQAISHCIMGIYVSSVKSSGCAHLRHSKSKCAFSFYNAFLLLFIAMNLHVHFNNVFQTNPGLLFKIYKLINISTATKKQQQ